MEVLLNSLYTLYMEVGIQGTDRPREDNLDPYYRTTRTNI